MEVARSQQWLLKSIKGRPATQAVITAVSNRGENKWVSSVVT